jgi:hypothetical protein
MAREKSMTDLKTSKARLNLLFHANEAGDFNVKPMLNLNYICNFKYTIAFKIILNILCALKMEQKGLEDSVSICHIIY